MWKLHYYLRRRQDSFERATRSFSITSNRPGIVSHRLHTIRHGSSVFRETRIVASGFKARVRADAQTDERHFRWTADPRLSAMRPSRLFHPISRTELTFTIFYTIRARPLATRSAIAPFQLGVINSTNLIARIGAFRNLCASSRIISLEGCVLARLRQYENFCGLKTAEH